MLKARAETGRAVVETEFPTDDKFEGLGGAASRKALQHGRCGVPDGARGLRQVLLFLCGALYAGCRIFAPCRNKSWTKPEHWPKAA